MDSNSNSTLAQQQLSTTTFLIRNLHCPSCVSNVDNSLFALTPNPVSVSSSILSQTVVVQHDISLTPKTIAYALEEAGFEIDSLIEKPPTASDQAGKIEGDETNYPQVHLAEEVSKRWSSISRHKKDGGERTKARHIERCDLCQTEEAKRPKSGTPTLVSDEELSKEKHQKYRRKKGQLDGVVSEVDQPLTAVQVTSLPKLTRASLSISGMTCSSCVGTITEALESKSWVQSVHVNLLTNSASVEFYGVEHLQDIVGTIEDAGYEAAVHETKDTQDLSHPGLPLTDDTWRATYSVAGITCSSCVATITRALEMFDWVSKVEVNPISNSAMVLFKGKSNLNKIAETIEELGYEAKLSTVDELNKAHEQSTQRTVTIRIDGMYCDHCPPRILEALKAQGTGLKIEGTLARKDPFLKVTYVPDAPKFTIRRILTSISAIDPAFQVSIHHPPTLEERSRKMQAHHRRRLLFRLILSITAAIPTFVIGIVFMSLLPSSNASRQYLMHPIWSGSVSRAEWALFITATPVYFFAADIFHRRAIAEIRALWRPGSQTPILHRFYRFGSMDMLMSLGVSIAYFASIAVLAIDATHSSDAAAIKGDSSYFDAVVLLTMFLLTGRLLEAYSKAKAGDAVTTLGKLRPTEAILIDDGDSNDGDNQDMPRPHQQLVLIDMLEYGDTVRVLHGGSPPCDGIIIEGESRFDESSLTGESRLVGKSIGDEVFSGTINKGDPISIQISRTSGASMLDQIVAAVREGQAKRAPIERVADIITSYFVPFVTLIAVSVWIIWLSLGLSGSLPQNYLDVSVGGWPFWSLQFAIAVFVIACPCGIGLAAPTALFVGGGLAATHGILVKGGGEAFQEASNLDCIVFDKTGTLTQGGEPAITDHKFLAPDDSALILSTVKILEESSGHPIAKAVVSFCNTREMYEVHSTNVEEIPGKGMKGSFTSKTMPNKEIEVLIGNEALMADFNVNIPEPCIAILENWKTQGNSVALVAMRQLSKKTPEGVETAWNLSAIFAVADPLRPEARNVIQALRSRGIDIWMISGDNPTTAYAVGSMVGIPRTNIIAGVLPHEKAEKIKYLQQSLKKTTARSIFGKRREQDYKRAMIAMVGDGINDSPALTVADVGIAIGSGSDVAISSADFVLISSGLTSLLTLIDLSRTVFTRIKFNFGWALVYNILALPIAAGVLYPVKSNGAHVRLDPVWASLAMALSSLSVVCSSLLLRTRLPVVGFRLAKRDLDREV